MDFNIRNFCQGSLSHDLDGIVALWNNAVIDAHGFFPLSAKLYQSHVIKCNRFLPKNLLLACIAGEIVGALHLDVVQQPYYETAGVIEAIMVAPPHRNKGVATSLMNFAMTLLQQERICFIDGNGSWPYSPFYSCLIDGSERSGVFAKDQSLLKLFDRWGFKQEQPSLVLQLDPQTDLTLPTEKSQRILDNVQIIHQERHGNTWLDWVFRRWELFSHKLIDHQGRLLSRALYARMDDLSAHTGRQCYAIFGVRTPPEHQQQGWANLNLQTLFHKLAKHGAQELELHVYCDNIAAINLYTRLGFKKIARTHKLRWHHSQ